MALGLEAIWDLHVDKMLLYYCCLSLYSIISWKQSYYGQRELREMTCLVIWWAYLNFGGHIGVESNFRVAQKLIGENMV